ncbi:MAG: TniQ family protein [Dermatophilaceae bacterium]|nr:TniQ family protein [Candidatus Phosphoribacter baldrii]MBK6956532.1 TniQ family protein [Candidatus Phosphoribacter baldrii]MBP8881751.1 TniQ family protein [Dermatophilaceae bacterium]MBP9918804.1 TniQ family protein [Dermatophilaceae bacterium]
MTRLPLALSPFKNESWPSYLTRRAAQHGTTLAELGTHLGLRDGRGRWPGRFGIELAPYDVQRLAPILGLVPTEIENMQLSSYDQLALDLTGLAQDSPIAATRATTHAAWVWLAGSTFCPVCLAEDDGAWRLSWRIPWITACVRHGVALRGSCADCGGVPGLGNRLHGSAPPRVAAAPDGRLCSHPHPRPGGAVCGADLSAQQTGHADPRRLARAHQMAELVSGQRSPVAGVERTSLQALRAWQSAIGIAVRLGAVDAGDWGRTHRWANPPRDPDLVDRLLESVEPLVNAKEPESAADVLGGWLRQAGISSPNATTFSRITQPSAALQPVIDEALSRCGRAHTLIQRRLVGQDGLALDQRGWGVDDVPQLVWPCALPEHLRHSTKPDQRILRAVVSMVLVRMCTDAKGWVEAGAALGFPPDKSRNWSRYAFSAKLAIKADLVLAAQALGAKLAQEPGSVTFQCRSQVNGFGSGALQDVQSPMCLDQGGSEWCPCHA